MINTGAPHRDVEEALADVLHDALERLHPVRQNEMKLRAFADCGDIVRTYLDDFRVLLHDSTQFRGEGLVEFYKHWVNPNNRQDPRTKFVWWAMKELDVNNVLDDAGRRVAFKRTVKLLRFYTARCKRVHILPRAMEPKPVYKALQTAKYNLSSGNYLFRSPEEQAAVEHAILGLQNSLYEDDGTGNIFHKDTGVIVT